jgi:hypothetical protein
MRNMLYVCTALVMGLLVAGVPFALSSTAQANTPLHVEASCCPGGVCCLDGPCCRMVSVKKVSCCPDCPCCPDCCPCCPFCGMAHSTTISVK